MAFDAETIIVGAGAAGMNCAFKLQEAKRPYLLISDTIGGRICNDEQKHMNYGAVFYFGSYKNMLASDLLIPGPDVLPSLTQGCCHPDKERQYAALSVTTALDAPSLLRFTNFMKKEFLPHYTQFKENCEVMEVRAALEKDPFINQLYHETAAQMIERVGFKKIADDLVSMFAHGCTGSKISTLSGLDYLNCVQPLTLNLPSMSTYMSLKRFDFDSAKTVQRLAEGSGGVVMDTVRAVEQLEGGWAVVCASGARYTAQNLVMAAPADVTRDLLAPVEAVENFEVRNASVLYGYVVAGKMKDRYEHHMVHIFTDSIPIIFTAKRFDGDYEVFTEIDFEEGRKFDEYFDEWEVLGVKHWEKALFTNPNLVLPQNLAPGLIMAGDHNGLGMEPAAISGIYAANKIMGKTQD
ncbi:FAD/NAD(P)-binding protein [Eggerthella sp. YY7918]|uniref:NAD(P)-binding protein n=1 Tax=Eggerthella sp. (strain YY7918) TaxID=502558 RepID=UPI0002171714|nr:FAD/NAD(P)-binding protein [Eggerthella sp. YY7918]BAK44486.1 uncharacterized ACR [Eggerthella sp. YY7918]